MCHKSLSTAPMVSYLSAVLRKTDGGNIGALADYLGVSVRHFSRYFGVTADGDVYAKVPAIPLSFADSMLTHAGDETLHTIWDAAELEGNYRPKKNGLPKCKRCNIELIKARKNKLCGFCIEETTGKTLTYRQREMY